MQTERKIQEISRYLRTFCHGHQDSWSQYLGWAEFGYQPPLFPWSGEPSDIPVVDHWFRESERVWDSSHHQLQRALSRCRRTANLRWSDAPAYQPGQKVWLSTKDIHLRLPCRKLSPRFIGPFTILKQINPSLATEQPNPPPPPLLLDDGTTYELKETLDSRRRGGQLEYLVDWEGYGPEERSWVPCDDILDPNLLETFHTAHPHRPAPRGRGLQETRLVNVRKNILLIFKNFTIVPSEADVLKSANALLDPKIRRARDLDTQKLSDPVSIQDVTYQKIDNNSYIISFAFQISNVTIYKNIQLRNQTYDLIQNTINRLLNDILYAKEATPFVFPQANYEFNGKEIVVDSQHTFVEGDTKWTPSEFVSAVLNIRVSSTTASPATTKLVALTLSSTPSIISGSAVVQTWMVFSSTSSIPSKSLVLSSTETLLSSRLTNLIDSVKVLNFTYEKISDTNYAVIFTFSISNISISENSDLRNNTYNQVASISNNVLNVLLNKPGAEPFKPHNFSFILGNVLIYIRLVFKNLTRVPSEADILNAANALLDAKIRRARDLVTQKLSDPVSIQEVKYQKIENKPYIISFGFQINNVTISKDIQLRNETYTLIQTTINSLLNIILNVKDAPEFVFPFANYTNCPEPGLKFLNMLSSINRCKGDKVPDIVGTAKLTQAITLLPRQEHLVWGKLLLNIPASMGSTILIEPARARTHKKSIMVRRVIASMSGDGWVPFRIINPLDKPITLKRNSKIADVFPVVAVEDLGAHSDQENKELVSVQSQCTVGSTISDEDSCIVYRLPESLQKLNLGNLDIDSCLLIGIVS
ncbi:hypothetical protein QTP70_009186 [Hemibagrus guttatus]|uniref:Chromo domain-containing protein n=1 Tax=Hemibagrus guttatus TaxID=175788 RepID=A0AAE0VF23_9TELE|nr:hypothetical protein QTP70_009186 [Hemibagrus guttatus]